MDPGSLQAALDVARYANNNPLNDFPLNSLYQGEGMGALWTADLANRVEAMAGQHQTLTHPHSAFEKARWDVQTSMTALALINRAKAVHFPQQKATVEDLRGFKQALLDQSEQVFLQKIATESSLIAQLRRAESTYSKAVSNGGWHPVDSGDMMFADHGEDVGLLKMRLAAEGYAAGEGNLFDRPLQLALEQYQKVQGLEVHGKLDNKTQRALNVPAWKRLRTVRANIARFESMAHLKTENHIVVNIPAYNAEYYQGGEQVWQDRVIVGKTDRRTPQLASKIKKVVFNPSWYVPSTIANRDILPRASRDPSYWRRMGYQAYDRSGQVFDLEAGANMSSVFAENRLRIKQPPGPSNALGQVKFLFPNKYAVYLHDTPNKKLFGRDQRAFSSGCVRVQEPLKLAEILFNQQIKRGHRGMQDQSIDQVIAAKKTRSYVLDEPVPVSTIYLTAEPLASGRVRFHKDIYDYDTADLAARAKSLVPSS
ncbi:MAG: L,D-transpeptidase family protein [Granulosicoccaceae bacterium]